MWIVAKVKRKEFNIFKQKLVEKFGKDTQFYHPKLQYQRYIKNKIKKFEKFILENYVFCYHEKAFRDLGSGLFIPFRSTLGTTFEG